MKGRKARGKVRPGFEGGQTPIYLRQPKRGMGIYLENPRKPLLNVPIGRISNAIDSGKIDPELPITIKTLYDADLINKKHHWGIKVTEAGAHRLKHAIQLEVTDVTSEAQTAVQELNGSVHLKYFNKRGLRAFTRPYLFEFLPRTHGTPPPKYVHKYPEYDQTSAWDFNRDPKEILQEREEQAKA